MISEQTQYEVDWGVMRLVVTTIILVIKLSNPCATAVAQSMSQPTDRNLEGLVGQVKSIDEEEAEIKMKGGKQSEGSRHRSRTVIYDRQGRMTHRWVSISGSDSSDQSFSYSKNNIRHRRYSNYDPASNNIGTTGAERRSVSVFRFDATENALYEDVYVGDDPTAKALTQRYKSRFDASGRVIEKIGYTIQGVAVTRNVYTYEVDNNPREERLVTTGIPNPQIVKYTYVLDSQGNWIKRIAENTLADSARTQRIEVTYRKISYY